MKNISLYASGIIVAATIALLPAGAAFAQGYYYYPPTNYGYYQSPYSGYSYQPSGEDSYYQEPQYNSEQNFFEIPSFYVSVGYPSYISLFSPTYSYDY